MTSLESIVLPLEQSRSLVERGIVLDTALVSFHYGNTEHWGIVTREDALQYARMNSDDDIPRPVLSELLDAIRAKCLGNLGFCHFDYVNGQRVWQVWWGESELLSEGQAHGEGGTYLLAAAALLMEVSK